MLSVFLLLKYWIFLSTGKYLLYLLGNKTLDSKTPLTLEHKATEFSAKIEQQEKVKSLK